MADSADVVVIGGGLHGMSASLHLARAGLSVVVFERSWVGRHASGATAAGVRILNRAFAEIPLALEANRIWQGIEEFVGDDCGFHAHGTIKVAETEERLDELRARRDRVLAQGYDHEEIIDRQELLSLVPNLAPHCVGAIMVRRDGAADPHRTVQAFRRAAEREGVRIFEGAGVYGASYHNGSWTISAGAHRCVTANVVNTAGAWAGRAGKMLGDELPLQHLTPMMIATERIQPLLRPVISVQGRKLSFKQSNQGTLILGGGYQGISDLDTEQGQPLVARLGMAAQAATDLFPSIRNVRIARFWMGIEASTRDHLPVIEASVRAPRVFHAAGFSGHGFQLAPVVGRIISELVTTGRASLPIAPFASARLRDAA